MTFVMTSDLDTRKEIHGKSAGDGISGDIEGVKEDHGKGSTCVMRIVCSPGNTGKV